MESSLVVTILILHMIITATSIEMTNELDEDFPNERNALVHLRDILNSKANLHSNWTGPPCQRNSSRWTGIGCTNGRVTLLVLEGLNVTGSIPQTLLQNLTFLSKLSLRNNSIRGPLPDLSGLMNLQFLFLSRNLFSGSIPISYANNLPKLTKLELQKNHLQGSIPPFDQQTLVAFNVSYNRLNGSIPETPVLERFSASSFDNNPNLCGKPLDVQCPIIPSRKGSNKGVFKLWCIIVIAAAVALVPFFIIIFFLCYYRRNQKKEDIRRHKPGDGAFSEKKSSLWSSESTHDPERIHAELEFFDRNSSRRRPVFDLDDLLRASAEVIGRGKLGTTYKAAVECGGDGGSTVTVAVKRLMKDVNIGLSKKEFVQQMNLLGNLRHENLVEIISYYYAKEEKLLISEYVSHGNLFQLLHENRGIGRQAVNWRTRLSIIHDIAKGLHFLHNSLPSSSHKVPPPHANLKSTNVLLLLFHHENNNNNNSSRQYYYSCKLSDYGFLPLLPSRKSSWEKLASSRSPEFCSGKKVTAKTDIYSFGIVVLEIITGKTPTDDHDLSEWVRTVVNTDWSTDILDLEIVSEKEGYDEMLKLTKIALECTDIVPENRPKMCEVLTRIEEVLETNY